MHGGSFHLRDALVAALLVLVLGFGIGADVARLRRARRRNGDGLCASCGRPLELDAPLIPIAGASYGAAMAAVCHRCGSRDRLTLWIGGVAIVGLAILAAIAAARL